MSILYAASVLAKRMKERAYPPFDGSSLVLLDPDIVRDGVVGGTLDNLVAFLKAEEVVFVGIGTTSYAFRWAIRLAETLKTHQPSCPVVLGGPHEDEYGPRGPGASISEYGHLFDFSIQGDGEYLLDYLFERLWTAGFSADRVKLELATAEEPLHGVRGLGGIAFRDSRGSIHQVSTSPNFGPGLRRASPQSLALGDTPLPPRHLLQPNHRFLFDIFTRPDGSLKPTAQVMTHRGCTYACSFCSERGSYSGRSPASVVTELAHLHREEYEAVFFDDSTFHEYRQLPELLAELEVRRGELSLEYGCLTRADALLHDTNRCPLRLFVGAGFTYFYLGIEQLNDRVLDKIRKGYGSREIRRCLKMLAAFPEIRLGASLLFGVESEDGHSIRETLRLVASNPQIILANMSIVAYHAGSVLGRSTGHRFDVPIPHQEWEWDLFEEGRWFHANFVDLAYVRQIIDHIRDIEQETGGQLLRKIRRASVLRERTGTPSV